MPTLFNTHPKKHGQGAFWHVWCVTRPRSLGASFPATELTPHPSAPLSPPSPLVSPRPPRHPHSRKCGNNHGLIRKYHMMLCRRCFRENANAIGFVKYR